MKKIRIIQIIELVILIIIAVGLISFLSSVSKKNVEGKQSKSFNYSFDFNFGGIGTGNLEVVKEEELSSTGIEKIEINTDSADVNVVVTDDEVIKIVESSDKALKKGELFTLSNQNGVLTITEDKSFSRVIMWGWQQHKIELFIPKGYIGDLALNTSSGDIKLLSDLKVKRLATGQASGDIYSEYSLEAESFSSDLASGDMRFNYLECNEYEISTASGDIAISTLKGSGSVETSSGDVEIEELTGGNYQVQTASGDVSLRNLQGSGEISSQSGDIDASYMEITEYAKLSASSGDIQIRLEESIGFEMNATCSSGDIDGTIDMNYTNKKGNEAVAVVGNAPYAKLILNTSSGDITVDQN